MKFKNVHKENKCMIAIAPHARAVSSFAFVFQAQASS